MVVVFWDCKACILLANLLLLRFALADYFVFGVGKVFFRLCPNSSGRRGLSAHVGREFGDIWLVRGDRIIVLTDAAVSF